MRQCVEVLVCVAGTDAYQACVFQTRDRLDKGQTQVLGMLVYQNEDFIRRTFAYGICEVVGEILTYDYLLFFHNCRINMVQIYGFL